MDGPTPDADVRRQHAACHLAAALLVVGAALLRLLFLAWNCPLDLAPDEAHYWDWSRHLDWSYYSKGPGIAWLIRLSCELFGGCSVALTGNEMLAVRLPAVVCGSLLLASMYVLTVQVGGRPRIALLVIAVALTTPALSAGSSLMTIDSPYTCCWGWALVAGFAAVFRGWRPGWWLAGLLVALGILFKYTMVLWLPSLGLFLLTGEYRRLLASRGFAVLVGLAGLSAVPILVWNVNHDWVTFHHVSGLAGLRQDRSQFHWAGPLVVLAVQGALWLVFWFIVWMRAMLAYAPWRPVPAGMRYLWWMSAPMFGVFFLFGFKTGGGEPNWPVTAFISGLVLGVLWMVDEMRTASGWYRRASLAGLTAALTAGLLLTAFVHSSAWFDPLLVPLAGPPTVEQPFPLRRLDPTLRLKGWQALATEVDRLRADLRARDLDPVLAGTSWSVPGLLAFYCEGHPTAYTLGPALGDRRSQYDFWRPNPISDSEQFVGRTFLVVSGGVLHVGAAFDWVEPHPVIYREHGQAVAGWTIYICHGFRGFGGAIDPAKNRHY